MPTRSPACAASVGRLPDHSNRPPAWYRGVIQSAGDLDAIKLLSNPIGLDRSANLAAAKGKPVAVKQLLRIEPDGGTTNIRNVKSKHWTRWLGVENRCVVPFNSFSEFNKVEGDLWVALDENRPLTCFAGIWTNCTSVRKVKQGRDHQRLLRVPHDRGRTRANGLQYFLRCPVDPGESVKLGPYRLKQSPPPPHRRRCLPS
jgi:hypothetical protein